MSTENKNLGSFLMKLSEDPNMLKSFEADPDNAMKSANLSSDEMQIVLNKDSKSMGAALKQHVVESLGSKHNREGDLPVVTVVVIVLSRSGK